MNSSGCMIMAIAWGLNLINRSFTSHALDHHQCIYSCRELRIVWLMQLFKGVSRKPQPATFRDPARDNIEYDTIC